jgi:hypothetical protein
MRQDRLNLPGRSCPGSTDRAAWPELNARKSSQRSLAQFMLLGIASKPRSLRRSLPMSLFGAMNTAISGLNAQSDAFSNISDNVANAQTVGYKRVDTNFVDYLTTSTSSVNAPGSVAARPD